MWEPRGVAGGEGDGRVGFGLGALLAPRLFPEPQPPPLRGRRRRRAAHGIPRRQRFHALGRGGGEAAVGAVSAAAADHIGAAGPDAAPHGLATPRGDARALLGSNVLAGAVGEQGAAPLCRGVAGLQHEHLRAVVVGLGVAADELGDGAGRLVCGHCVSAAVAADGPHPGDVRVHRLAAPPRLRAFGELRRQGLLREQPPSGLRARRCRGATGDVCCGGDRRSRAMACDIAGEDCRRCGETRLCARRLCPPAAGQAGFAVCAGVAADSPTLPALDQRTLAGVGPSADAALLKGGVRGAVAGVDVEVAHAHGAHLLRPRLHEFAVDLLAGVAGSRQFSACSAAAELAAAACAIRAGL
mmetsp:Transcript_132325/g.423376  ORF Transcript_132325/g.423376 Transcript_132325/m.423376 type:complete len:356 (-) Transcript_132325:464-1531(-)